MHDLSVPVAYDAEKLLQAFPLSISLEAKIATRQLALWTRRSYPSCRFPVTVLGERVLIPERLAFSGFISPLQPRSTRSFVKSCLRTRSIDGFERQKALRRIVLLNEPWSIPFVIALIGDYVIEILEDIFRHIDRLDATVVRGFLSENPHFYYKTRQRVASYRDAHYRQIAREDHAGFRILAVLVEMMKNDRDDPLRRR